MTLLFKQITSRQKCLLPSNTTTSVYWHKIKIGLLLERNTGNSEHGSLLRYCAMHREIALMMEAVSTSERTLNLYETTSRYIPEDCHTHARH
jgi:hypothetical protein